MDPVQLQLADQLLKILCLYGKERVGNCERIPYYGEVSLEEAFEQYIGYRQDPMSPQSEDNKNQMLNRLTRFAERVRVLGNFSILAVGAQKEIQEETVLESRLTSLLGATSRTDKGKASLESLDYFVRVLQAIGNTILFQVDAIRTTHAWNKMIEDRLQQEIASLGRSDYASLLKPEDTQKLGMKTSREVLDQVVSTLQYRYLHEVENDGPRKEAIGNALKEAYAYRANQVFLRSSAG